MRCSSSESGTSLPPSWSMRRSKEVSHTIWGATTRPARFLLPTVRTNRARTPLLIAPPLHPNPLRAAQGRRDDGVVAEAAPDVVDGPAGVVPTGLLDVVEAQLAGAVVHQVRDAHAEQPHARRRVDVIEQLLGGAGDDRSGVDRGGQGHRAGDRAEVVEAHLDRDRPAAEPVSP